MLVGIIAALVVNLPQITGEFPAPGAPEVSSRAPIRLTFSQPMAQASVEAALKITPSTAGQFSWTGNTVVFAPAQPWPAGQTISVSLAGGTSARGLPLRGTAAWSFTVSRPRLAYLAGAPPNVWVMPLTDNAQPQQVTTETLGLADYDITPDGTRLVYAAWRQDGGADLRAINVDGTGAGTVLACPQAACLSPAVAPDGRTVAYQLQALSHDPAGGANLGAAQVHLYTFDTGSDEPMGNPAHETRTPRWSPDGRLSFYDVTQQVMVIRNLQTQAETDLPDLSGEMGTWSPDGRYVIFPETSFLAAAASDTSVGVGEAPSNYLSQLQRVDVATKARENLSGSQTVDDGSPVYSPLGDWLAFGRKTVATGTWTPGRQLWLMHFGPAGIEARAVTNEPEYNTSAFAWSLDGSALAYVRINTGALDQPSEIWLVNADGSGARLLVTGGYLPQRLP
jgi:Tol biopolymer transport system component